MYQKSSILIVYLSSIFLVYVQYILIIFFSICLVYSQYILVYSQYISSIFLVYSQYISGIFLVYSQYTSSICLVYVCSTLVYFGISSILILSDGISTVLSAHSTKWGHWACESPIQSFNDSMIQRLNHSMFSIRRIVVGTPNFRRTFR